MFEKLLEGLTSKVRLMVGRAVISALRHDGAIHRAQLRLLADEIADDVEVMQEYGFSSAPKEGAEAAVIFIGGNRDAGLVVATHDRRYRLALEAGEVALHDDLGQKVHLTRNGIVAESSISVTASAPMVTLVAETKVRVEAPLLECTGQIKDLCDAPSATTVSAMREVFNGHLHSENNVLRGPTSGPNQEM